MKLVNYIKFKSIMKDVLIGRGVSSSISEIITSSLIETSLKGVDSHGINLFIHYLNELDSNRRAIPRHYWTLRIHLVITLVIKQCLKL